MQRECELLHAHPIDDWTSATAFYTYHAERREASCCKLVMSPFRSKILRFAQDDMGGNQLRKSWMVYMRSGFLNKPSGLFLGFFALLLGARGPGVLSAVTQSQ